MRQILKQIQKLETSQSLPNQKNIPFGDLTIHLAWNRRIPIAAVQVTNGLVLEYIADKHLCLPASSPVSYGNGLAPDGNMTAGRNNNEVKDTNAKIHQ